MTQRNPMNERYTGDGPSGATRKSAASAKPKTKAASSVTITSAAQSPKEKKLIEKQKRKEAQERQRELDRKYYNPTTERYKKLRRLWWILIGGAILCTIVSFVCQQMLDPAICMVILVGAYACIIAAFYIDFSKIRKERTRYQQEMVKLEEKEKKEKRAAAQAARQQQAHKKGSGKNASRNPKTQQAAAEAREAQEAEDAQAKKEGAEEAPVKRGLFGSGFRLSNREKMKAAKEQAKEAQANAQAEQAVEAPEVGTAEESAATEGDAQSK